MKEETWNEYEKAVNKVVDYINDHLYSNPSLRELSDIAGISGFHFHRIFRMIIGENPGEYIIRLRLEDIAHKLTLTPTTIESLALDAGFSSKHALSKAFKKHFGKSPSEFRKQRNTSHFVANQNFKHSHIPIPVIIEHVQSKNIAYVRVMDKYGSQLYCKAWTQLMLFGTRNKLIKEETEYLNLFFDDPTVTQIGNCRSYISFTVEKSVKPSGAVGITTVKGGLYAIFLHWGSYRNLVHSYHYIYCHWLQESEYELSHSFCYELYLNSPSLVSEKNLCTEIYIPIKKRQ